MTMSLERLAAAVADRYRILNELGQGGMATVYLAEDLRHDRKVALKVLKPELAAVIGAERFVVEIKTTAALQHPHILPLFDSGSADGFLYYVMPYIQGETLRAKLDRETQFSVDEALRIAIDVAGALDYAHRHGVIHRDIKPENILMHDGRPMVADFGIALALSAAAGGRMTETGMSLGTPHYMSPEQATAEKELTGRSDVYSLASVLYEMLTGEPPHMGKSAQQIIMKIIAEPVKPVTDLRKSVPEYVALAVARALEKLPADRQSSAAEFAAALQGQGGDVLRTTVRSASTAPQRNPWRSAAYGLAGVAAVLVAVTGWLATREPERRVVRLGVAFPKDQAMRPANTRRFNISPDGKRVVYVGPDSAGTQLWVRELDGLSARPIPGTYNAQAPFFSPDGLSVGFITANGGDVRTVPISGGPTITLVRDSAAAWGADWGADGNIYFTTIRGRIGRVSASGGKMETLSTPDTLAGQTEHDWPQLLPGGRHVLVQIWRQSISDTQLGVLDIESGKTTPVTDGAFGRLLPNGDLVFATFNGALSVAPLDIKAATLSGPAVGIVDGVQVDPLSGSAAFAVSENGTLIYALGNSAGRDRVVWMDRSGKMEPVDSTWRGQFNTLALSPDGRRLAISLFSSEGEQVWMKELPRGPLTRITTGPGSNYRPTWSPDGRMIAYISIGAGRRGVYQIRADGGTPPESLYSHPKNIDEAEWSPDGRTLVIRVGSGGGADRDIFAVANAGRGAATPLVASRFEEFGMDVSPDGKWLAYSSSESGRSEVFVRPFADPGAFRVQVSVEGGDEATWSRSGRELFYRTRRGEMIAAEIQPGAAFSVKSRRALFANPALGADPYHRAYDVSPDDRRFIMIDRPIGEATDIVVVFNWDVGLSRAAKR
jgi:eukaryotic-like serine/threonine-protein kinase